MRIFSRDKRTALLILLGVNFVLYGSTFAMSFFYTLPDEIMFGVPLQNILIMSLMPVSMLYTCVEAFFYFRRDSWPWCAILFCRIIILSSEAMLVIWEVIDFKNDQNEDGNTVLPIGIFFAIALVF